MTNHVVSTRVYFLVFVALIVLTWVTVAVSRIDLGPLSTVTALAIACAKAVLVILYFMHLKYVPQLTKLVVAGGFLWLALLIGLTMMDFQTRDWM